jgi:hypothetical protein
MSHLFHRAEVEQLNFSEGTITIQTQQNEKNSETKEAYMITLLCCLYTVSNIFEDANEWCGSYAKSNKY